MLAIRGTQMVVPRAQTRQVPSRTPLVVAQAVPIKGGRKHSSSKGPSITRASAAGDAVNVPYYMETGRCERHPQPTFTRFTHRACVRAQSTPPPLQPYSLNHAVPNSCCTTPILDVVTFVRGRLNGVRARGGALESLRVGRSIYRAVRDGWRGQVAAVGGG